VRHGKTTGRKIIEEGEMIEDFLGLGLGLGCGNKGNAYCFTCNKAVLLTKLGQI
jgi:hypothetical protein